jgi:large subunit ribosomal protein L7/L12
LSQPLAALMMAGPAAGAAPAAAAVQTEFDVVLTSFGDKKLDVVKEVKNITGASLMDAKKMVEAVPSKIKEKVSKEEADKIKATLEKAGAAIELK